MAECGELKGINLSLPGNPRSTLRIFRDSVADYEAKQSGQSGEDKKVRSNVTLPPPAQGNQL
jgi:molybdopterin biosynthesis enzyme